MNAPGILDSIPWSRGNGADRSLEMNQNKAVAVVAVAMLAVLAVGGGVPDVIR